MKNLKIFFIFKDTVLLRPVQKTGVFLSAVLMVCMPSVMANLGYEKVFSQKQETKQKAGFIETYRKKYFGTLKLVDRLIEKYRAYYTVDEKKRSISETQKLTPKDVKDIKVAHKELEDVVAIFSKCSPGDYDYLEIKEKYLPVALEMRHRFHTFVMQPLKISALDAYDHARKILTPCGVVAAAVVMLLVLKKLGYLPAWLCCSPTKLLTMAAAVAAAGILYNYSHELSQIGHGLEIFHMMADSAHHFEQGTDFGALIQKAQAVTIPEQAQPLFAKIAQDVEKVTQNP